MINLLSNCLLNFATQIFTMELITEPVYKNPTYLNVMNHYENGMKFKVISELEKHCQVFLDSLSSQGGPMKHAAKATAEYWNNEISNEFA